VVRLTKEKPVEAFFQVTQQFRGSALDPRFYRSTAKLLAAIEGRWITPITNESSYEVKLFTDHEAWDKDFSQEELTRVVNELVDSYAVIDNLQYYSDGKPISGVNPDYKRLVQEWKAQSLPKLQAVVRGALK
jgi:hypothetical protein